MSTAPACTAGWGSITQGGRRPRSRIGREVVGRGRAAGSRRGGWRRRWPVILAVVVTRPRAGRYRCWRTTWPHVRALPSAPGRCDADSMRRTIAGSGRAMSMPGERCIWPRKRGSGPPPEGRLASGRHAAVHRLDAAAAVPATARDLGARGNAGRGADHRHQCQTGAIRRDRPADRTPHRAGPPPCRAGRRAGVPRRTAPALPPRRPDLAVGRSRERPYRPADPGGCRPAAHSVAVAAQAGTRTEPDGSALARAQEAHRSQPAGRLNRRLGRRCSWMAPDVDATAGTPKGWHDLEAILAEGPVAALLATYLASASMSTGSPSASGRMSAALGERLPSSWVSGTASATSWSMSLATGVRAATALLTAALRK